MRPYGLLLGTFLFAACGDSGGEPDAGTADTGPALVTCPEIIDLPDHDGPKPHLSGSFSVNGSAYTFDCDLSNAPREDALFLETPNITSGVIKCQRAEEPRYTITIDIKAEPLAKTYVDGDVIEVSALLRDGVNLNGPTAQNTSFHEIVVECWDKTNRRINGRFEARFSEENADPFNGYGELTGTFAANLQQ